MKNFFATTRFLVKESEFEVAADVSSRRSYLPTKAHLNMKLNILVTSVLAVPLVLTTTVRVQSTVPQQPLPMVQSPASATQLNWQEFSSQLGGFAVLMPGTPKEETETEDDGLLSGSLHLTRENAYYSVHYKAIADLEQLSPAQIQEILDRAPGEFAEGAAAKLVRSQTIALNGNVGREFEFDMDNGIVGKGRVFIVKQRLFIVVGITPEIQNSQRFLNSFRLL